MSSGGVARIKSIYLVATNEQKNCPAGHYDVAGRINKGNCNERSDNSNESHEVPVKKSKPDIVTKEEDCCKLDCDNIVPEGENGTGQANDDSKIKEASRPDAKPLQPRKLTKREKRGQNKSKDRPRVQKLRNDEKLCYHYIDGQPDTECPKLPGCNFLHDIQLYLERKMGKINQDCYVFKTYGKCSRGLTCAFAASHIDCDNKNVVNSELWERMQPYYEAAHKNILDNDSRLKLRHKEYDFKDIEEICTKLSTRPDSNIAIDVSTLNIEQKLSSGAFTDEDLVIPRIEELKKFDWENKLYLSPLTTVGNLPFRRLCVDYGADITCSEMSLATSILQGHAHEFSLHRRHPSEKIWGVQLCSNNVFSAAKAAQVLLDVGVEYDFVDLNLGCPLEPIYRMGAGSGLMTRGHNKLGSFMKGMSTILGRQHKLFTVKMRAGVKTNNFTAHTLIPVFRDAGVSMITLHGRTREQRYTKTADWNYVGQCAKLAHPVPLFGNGDVLSWEEYNQKKTISNTSGVMIGRGALMKPWIFQEIKEQRDIDMTSSQRLEMIQKYASYGLDHFGSDSQGVETTRRFLLEWLSFFHRYIPFGVLEETPQKINLRPPKYVGRDEMETLLASTNSNDWVKISEMFLGPVPANFVFLPKHKANSWS